LFRSHEQGNDYAHQQECRKVLVESEHIRSAVRRTSILSDNRQDESQQGCFQEVNKQVLFVADLCKRVARRKDCGLDKPVGKLEGMRWLLADVLYAMNAESFLIPVVPLDGRDLSLAGWLTVFVDHLCFDDIADLFRDHVPARFAWSPVGVYLWCRLFEGRHCLHRVTVVRRISTSVHNDHLVEHLVYVRRGLVDDDENELTLKRQFFQKVDDVF